MSKQKITRFLQSFVAIPLLAVGSPLAGIASIPQVAPTPTTVLVSNTTAADTQAITTQEEIREEHAKAIDTFLESYKSPLAGYGMKFVTEAEKNDIDWRLLVAIAGRESTFDLFPCKSVTNSFFGYGSCKINFKSVDAAIEKVSASLGGNDPATARHYDGKTTLQILRKYNSIIPNYPQEVIRIMKKIDKTDPII
jgi:hypothetical protein